MTAALAGRTVLVTRPAHQAAGLVAGDPRGGRRGGRVSGTDDRGGAGGRIDVGAGTAGGGRHRDFRQSQCRAIRDGGGRHAAGVDRRVRGGTGHGAGIARHRASAPSRPRARTARRSWRCRPCADVAGKRVGDRARRRRRALLAESLAARGARSRTWNATGASVPSPMPRRCWRAGRPAASMP